VLKAETKKRRVAKTRTKGKERGKRPAVSAFLKREKDDVEEEKGIKLTSQ